MRLRDGKRLKQAEEQLNKSSLENEKIPAVEMRNKNSAPATNSDIIEPGTSDLKGDYNNVALLLLLYILQGIPLGMAASIPMILQNKNVNYKQQAMFSLVYWPFSLKLLWAPIVDAAFFQKIGRRKTWLVPVQYLMALFMLVLSTVSKSK